MTPLKRLTEQYYYVKYHQIDDENTKYRKIRYTAMRELCLDCSLLSLAEIEQMEEEVNNLKN